MAKKTQVVMNTNTFEIENHWDDNLLGRVTWSFKNDFGWSFNDDGSVTIDSDKVAFAKYLASRGINESVQNSYQAHKKGTGLEPRRAAYNRRVADLKAGKYERGGERAEREVDVDDMTLKMVMFKSMITEYNITKKEAAVLLKSIDVAARRCVEESTDENLEPQDIINGWQLAAQEELNALPGM
jgi:hypothetical protein